MTGISPATRAHALATVDAAPEPLTVAELAAALGMSAAHAWVICRSLHAAREIRVGGWREDARGVRAPRYDTRVTLPDVPKPAPMSRTTSNKQYQARLRADPERLAAYMAKAREYHRNYERQHRRPRLSMHAHWCWLALRQLAGAARSPYEIARRAGLDVEEAGEALRELHTRDKRLVRIGGWLPIPGAPVPLYDLRVRQPDEPQPSAGHAVDKYAMLMHARLTNEETSCRI